MAKKKAATKSAKKAAKKAAKKPTRKHAAKPSTSTAPKITLSKKANTNVAALVATPVEQLKFTGADKRSNKTTILAKTHESSIRGHVAARGRRKQAARDQRNAPQD